MGYCRWSAELNLSAQSKMKKVIKTRAGSEVQYGPRRVGHIITEMFLGNSPLAKGYRMFLASKENVAEKGGEI